jgi:hypothetical protein
MIEDAINEMTRKRRDLAERLRFFDAGIWLGRPEGFPLAEDLSPDRIKDVLASRFLTGGLVSHWRGKTISPQEGNKALARAIKKEGQDLFTVWTGLPLIPAEAGPVPGSLEPPAIVRGVRIFPKSHNFPLADWCIGSLCDWLVSRRMPMFIWHTELDWDSLYQIAQVFPALTLIVETQTQKILYHTRPLFALMRDCRNVLVELSNFSGQGLVEYAVREFGAERLMFGSFLPVSDPFVPMGMLLDAELSEQDKALIAGDNLRHLVGEVKDG